MLIDCDVLKKNSHAILKFDHKVLRTFIAFHWKMACMPFLDEAIHQSGVKVGVGTLNLCKIHGFQKTWENKKN
jgi:hypothetical protein